MKPEAEKYMGKPCVRNHVSLRYKSTSACVECQREFSVKWREKKAAERAAAVAQAGA